MKVDRVISEPLLEFGGGGTSYDIREGISVFGPVDFKTPRAKTSVKIGIVGTGKTVAEFSEWMKECQDGIKGDNPLNQNLNPDFPGLANDVGFRATFFTDPSWVTEIPERELKKLIEGRSPVAELAKAFHEAIKASYELSSSPPDVVICLPPESVMKAVRPRFLRKADAEESDEQDGIDFHDYLKGMCLQTRSVFQLVWPRTYQHKSKETQDPATRAWNLFGGLFYKAGGAPWKLLNSPSGKSTCYVGISFSVREEGGFLHTSLTQVFNDKGEGTILRGGVAHKSEDDHEVHLPKESAERLLANAIENYRKANDGRSPDRVVIHKSSGFDDGELRGFNAVVEAVVSAFLDHGWTRIYRIGWNANDTRMTRELHANDTRITREWQRMAANGSEIGPVEWMAAGVGFDWTTDGHGCTRMGRDEARMAANRGRWRG